MAVRTIERVEVYRTMGKQFETFQAAVDFREGLIEGFFRKVPGFQDVPHKQRIAFVQFVIDNRKQLGGTA